MASWTGGRKRLKPAPPPVKKTLLVVGPLLFSKRDRQGKIPFQDRLLEDGIEPEWSELMLRQAAKVWEEVLVFFIPLLPIYDKLDKFLKPLNIPNIKLIMYPAGSTEEMTNFLKKLLIERGARIKPSKNPREITYINMRMHIEAPHMTWVSQNEHVKAKIDLDKPKSFMDLQSERKLKSSWG